MTRSRGPRRPLCVTVTILASVFTAIAAFTYFAGHDYPKAQLDMKRLPHSWMPMLGTLAQPRRLGRLLHHGGGHPGGNARPPRVNPSAGPGSEDRG
jgi:hypothetical protein